MTSPASKDVQEALGALERLLLRHKLVSPEQARAAARIITGDEDFEFPPPAPAAAPPGAAAPAPSPAPAADVPSPPPPPETASESPPAP